LTVAVMTRGETPRLVTVMPSNVPFTSDPSLAAALAKLIDSDQR